MAMNSLLAPFAQRVELDRRDSNGPRSEPSGSQRRDKRYRFQLPIVLRSGPTVWNVVTQDVSYRGMFVRAEALPKLRQLVKIEAVLPPGKTAFVSHAMSVYLIQPTHGTRSMGVGIQFYAMGDERAAWERFIDFIKAHVDEIPDSRG